MSVHRVIVGDPEHGVAGLALELTAGRPWTAVPALGGVDDARAARTLLPPAAEAPLVHLHLTDGLLGPDPAAALRELTRGRRVAVTLHDVPQDGEGEARRLRRAGVYAALAAETDLVLVSSEHERAGLTALGVPVDGVLPLPIDAHRVPAGVPDGSTVGVLGWVHPGKDYAGLASALAATGRPATVVALGGVARGHEGLEDELARRCAALGVGFRCTGYLDDMTLLHEAARVGVPVCPHRHVSASGSLGSWLSAGRRPIVVDGAYAREIEARNPGALTLTDDLPAALAAALDDPAGTLLPLEVRPGPTTARAVADQDAVLARWAAGEGPAA